MSASYIKRYHMDEKLLKEREAGNSVVTVECTARAVNLRPIVREYTSDLLDKGEDESRRPGLPTC